MRFAILPCDFPPKPHRRHHPYRRKEPFAHCRFLLLLLLLLLVACACVVVELVVGVAAAVAASCGAVESGVVAAQDVAYAVGAAYAADGPAVAGKRLEIVAVAAVAAAAAAGLDQA